MGTKGWVAYGTIFGVLVACGLGIPFPEDVSLITGGFLVFHGSADLSLMVATGFLGIPAGTPSSTRPAGGSATGLAVSLDRCFAAS